MVRVGDSKYWFSQLGGRRRLVSYMVDSTGLFFFLLNWLPNILSTKTVLFLDSFSILHFSLMKGWSILFFCLAWFSSGALVPFTVVAHSQLLLSKSRRKDCIEFDFQLYLVSLRFGVRSVNRLLILNHIFLLGYDDLFAVDN